MAKYRKLSKNPFGKNGEFTNEGFKELIEVQAHNTNVSMQKAAKSFKRHHPETPFLSVYICNGYPGDPLIIENKNYILVNKFIAVPLDSASSMKVEVASTTSLKDEDND